MTDEKDTNEAVTDKIVTDAELETKKDEIKEEVTEKKDEIKDTKKELEGAEDQAERSRLGRRLKRQEEQLSNLESKMDAFFSRFESMQSNQAIQSEDEGITDEDVRKYRLLSKKEREAQERYSQDYTSAFRKIGIKEDADSVDEVYDEMYKNFNVVRTGDPLVDAETNYAKASASLARKALAAIKPKANVKGQRDTASTSLNVTTRQEDTEEKEVELDEFAKEFVAKTGMKKESYKEALKGEAPIHLQSRK